MYKRKHNTALFIILLLAVIQPSFTYSQTSKTGFDRADSRDCVSAEIPVKLLFPGNWADPTVCKVDDTYYLTSNNDRYVPSVLVFKSKDLKNWAPVAYASPNQEQKPATDIVAVGNRLFIYGGGQMDAWVQYADPPYEKWSKRLNMEPVDKHFIDAGHIMDKAGNRYLYMSKGRVVKISKDGLKVLSAPVKRYDGWEIPATIAVEGKCLESPKLFWKDDFCYMVSAQGGTAGPATSHMVIVARAKNIEGPWENSPYNPVIYTKDKSALWWSKGHATFIEGPDKNWYAIYHGYRNGYRSWGRSTLISPLHWTDDGWPVLADKWPAGWDKPITINLELSDEFDSEKPGLQWQAYQNFENDRYHLVDGALEISGVNKDPGMSNPYTVNPRNLGYEVETEMVIEGDVNAGLILFYNPFAYITLGLTPGGNIFKHTQRSSIAPELNVLDIKIPYGEKRIRLKIRNDRQDVSYYYDSGNGNWEKLIRSDEISGFQHNIFGSYSSVRPGLFVTGKGKARFEYFRYKALTKE